MRTTSRPTLLVLRALGLGDFLTSVPALRALARAYPEHYRVLAAPLYLAPLVRLCGGIDEMTGASPLQPLSDGFGRVDVAVNLHGRGPQSHKIALATNPRRFVAFANAEIPESAGFPEWRPDEHETERWCRMLAEHGIPADSTDLEIRAPRGDVRSRGAIVVHPGAASESRRWPVDHWIELCGLLRGYGYRIVFTGSSAEFRRCRFIAKAARIPMPGVLAGQTNLEELTCVIASARALICGDTGTAHIATAVGTPSVLLFGPTSPHFWGPPADSRKHRVIWRGTPGDPHAPHVDPGLESIRPTEVIAELDALLQMPRAG